MTGSVKTGIVMLAGAAVAVGVWSLPSRAEPAPPLVIEHPGYTPPEERNAAIQYGIVWGRFPWGEWRPLSLEVPSVRNKMDEALAFVPGEEMAEFLDKYEIRFVEFEAVAAMDRCDWELPWERGVSTYLTHYPRFHDSARLLSCDAKRQIQLGEIDAAVDRLVGVLGVVRHWCQDGVFLSSFAASQFAELTLRTIESLLQESRLEEPQRERLGEALARFDETDPFIMAPAVEFYADVIFPASIRDLMHAEDFSSRERNTGSTFSGKTYADELPPMTAKERREVDEALELAQAWKQVTTPAWAARDVDAMGASILAVRNGEYGEVLKESVGSLNLFAKRMLPVVDLMNELRTALAE